MMSKLRNTRPLQARTRKAGRSLAGLAAVVAALAVSACGDSPTAAAPAAAPQSLRLSKSGSGSGTTKTIGRRTPLGAPVTVSYRIDPKKNGKFDLPGTGLEIEVPKGALREAATITVTALTGDAIAYQFQPHGLRFERPLEVRQDLRVLSVETSSLLNSLLSSLLGGLSGSSQLEVTYFADPSVLNGGGIVDVLEFLGSTLDLGKNRVEFEIEHFSGYMISWGRSRYN